MVNCVMCKAITPSRHAPMATADDADPFEWNAILIGIALVWLIAQGLVAMSAYERNAAHVATTSVNTEVPQRGSSASSPHPGAHLTARSHRPQQGAASAAAPGLSYSE
jgi:hypothetical protein